MLPSYLEEISHRHAKLRTLTNLGPRVAEVQPEIRCDCGRWMYWETEVEPRCPVHGVIYQPIQRKLINPLFTRPRVKYCMVVGEDTEVGYMRSREWFETELLKPEQLDAVYKAVLTKPGVLDAKVVWEEENGAQ